MAETTPKEDQVHKTALERYKECVDREAQDRVQRLEDLRFVTLDQWPKEIRAQRENDLVNGPRPCLTIDKIGQYRTQIINSIRKNRPMPKFRAVDNGAHDDAAEVFEGIARHIDDVSHADIAYENAAEWAIDTGAGYIRLTTEYINDDRNRQEIYIKQVADGFSVYLGPHLEPDGSDAEYGFIIQDIPLDKFKREFPKAKAEGKDFAGDNDFSKYWQAENSVRIAEYFYFDYEEEESEEDEKPVSTPVTQGGASDPLDEDSPNDDQPGERPKRKVKWCKLTAFEIIERGNWAGIYIPIVEVIGNRKTVDGKTQTWGIVRPAKDSCRLYNYVASAITEKIALAPKTPFIGAVGQFEGVEDKWRTANTTNHAYLEYNAIDVNGNAIPAPQRVAPAPLESAMIAQLQTIEHDIQTSLGMFKASVGQEERDQSGVAIRSLAAQSDTATFHFPDNLARSVRYVGKILADLIPRIYDTQDVIRIIGADGQPKQAHLDPTQQQAVNRVLDQQGNVVKSIYNLGVGRYDVVITSGASYATKRQESADTIGKVLQSQPQLISVFGDLWLRSMDWPMAEEMADRMYKLLPPELKDDGKNQQIPPQVQQQIQQATHTIQALTEENKKLKSGSEEKQLEVASEHQKSQQELQIRAQKDQAEMDLKRQKQAAELELEQQKEAALLDLERQKAAAKIQLEREIKMAQLALEQDVAAAVGGNPEKQQVVSELTSSLSQTMQMMGKIMEGFKTMSDNQSRSIDGMLEHQSKPKSVTIQKDDLGRVIGAEVRHQA